MITPTPLQILVIDDHSENRQVARWMLTQAFCKTEILEAESIEQAVELWDTRRLDCVLLDSAISSFESALVRLSQKHQTTGIPLVLLVSVQDELQRRLGIEQGVENWLVKETLSAQNIEMIVRKAMEISSLRLMLEEQGRELNRLRSELSTAATTPPPLPSTGLITGVAGGDSLEPPATSSRVEDTNEHRSGTQLVRPGLITNGFGTPTAEEDELARQIQSDLFPPGSPFCRRLRHCRIVGSGGHNRRRLLRLPAHSGWSADDHHWRVQRPRSGSGHVHGFAAGVSASAGHVRDRCVRCCQPREHAHDRRHR
jgi:CheY-like chemotaxis protein